MLVRPQSEDEIVSLLRRHGVPVSRWGRGYARTIEDLVRAVQLHECALEETPHGLLIRYTVVPVAILRDDGTRLAKLLPRGAEGGPTFYVWFDRTRQLGSALVADTRREFSRNVPSDEFHEIDGQPRSLTGGSREFPGIEQCGTVLPERLVIVPYRERGIEEERTFTHLHWADAGAEKGYVWR